MEGSSRESFGGGVGDLGGGVGDLGGGTGDPTLITKVVLRGLGSDKSRRSSLSSGVGTGSGSKGCSLLSLLGGGGVDALQPSQEKANGRPSEK